MDEVEELIGALNAIKIVADFHKQSSVNDALRQNAFMAISETIDEVYKTIGRVDKHESV